MKTATLPPRGQAQRIDVADLPEFTRHYDTLIDAEFFTVGDQASGPNYEFRAERLSVNGPLTLSIDVPWTDKRAKQIVNRAGFTWSRVAQAFTPSASYKVGRDCELTLLRAAVEACQLLGLRIYPSSRAALVERWARLTEREVAA